MKNNFLNKNILAVILIAIGILFRTVWHIGDNIEFVTVVSLIGGSYLGLKYALGMPLIIMMISDLIIGNTNIFLFTWSGYLMIGLGGWLINKVKSQKLKVKSKNVIFIKTIIKATGLGIISSFWFYLWTNFGVWHLDSFGMYPKTIEGLRDSYIMGIPFLKNNLLGNMITVPLFFTIFEYIRDWNFSFKALFQINKQKI